MSTPLLYRQLHEQFSQFIRPRDRRHLVGFAENVAAILQAESGCLSHWLVYLSHRSCQARSHLERLSYFVHNPRITSETFYEPLLQKFLAAWEGLPVLLTLDTSLFWEEYCLIEVCLTWGGRSFPLAQKLLSHPSASVAYQDYLDVLETALRVLPPNCQPSLLADRGFEHRELVQWLERQDWLWALRAKSNLKITFAHGQAATVAEVLPSPEQAHLFQGVTVLTDITCNLATANLTLADEPWAVMTNTPVSLQTFAFYGQRFGGIEPHFKDYKSAAFELPRSRLRDAAALERLLMLLATATIIALSLAIGVVARGQRHSLDWHSQRGLSFLQLGLREVKRLCYQRLPLPPLSQLPRWNPPPACASLKKRRALDTRIEFAKVTVFSF